jgi:hypothetical protein
MAHDAHKKAAEHHEHAAKAHHAAAEHHAKGDHHTAHEHATKAHGTLQRPTSTRSMRLRGQSRTNNGLIIRNALADESRPGHFLGT